jgi:hypothetical protein
MTSQPRVRDIRAHSVGSEKHPKHFGEVGGPNDPGLCHIRQVGGLARFDIIASE